MIKQLPSSPKKTQPKIHRKYVRQKDKYIYTGFVVTEFVDSDLFL